MYGHIFFRTKTISLLSVYTFGGIAENLSPLVFPI